VDRGWPLMEVHLGGHLAFYNRAKRARFEMHLESEAALLDVIREPGIPEAEIAMAAVNRTVVSLPEARVGDADRLDLYPPMSGGARAAPGPARRSLRLAGAPRPRGSRGRSPRGTDAARRRPGGGAYSGPPMMLSAASERSTPVTSTSKCREAGTLRSVAVV